MIHVPNYRIHKILNFLTKIKGSTIFDKASTPFWKNDASSSFRVRIRVSREISLHVQQRIRVDVGHVFGVKTNLYLKIKYTFEIFHQPAVKL